MKRLLYWLLGLLGFVAASCNPEPVDMYGTLTPNYKEDMEGNNNTTDRIEPNAADEVIYEEDR